MAAGVVRNFLTSLGHYSGRDLAIEQGAAALRYRVLGNEILDELPPYNGIENVGDIYSKIQLLVRRTESVYEKLTEVKQTEARVGALQMQLAQDTRGLGILVWVVARCVQTVFLWMSGIECASEFVHKRAQLALEKWPYFMWNRRTEPSGLIRFFARKKGEITVELADSSKAAARAIATISFQGPFEKGVEYSVAYKANRLDQDVLSSMVYRVLCALSR